MTVTEQITDYDHTRADQNTASVAAKTAAAAAGAVHKRGAASGPGSFAAHAVFNPAELGTSKPKAAPTKRTAPSKTKRTSSKTMGTRK